MVVEKKSTKLKITVDNSLPLYNINNEDHASDDDDLAEQGEVLFIDYLNHQDSALAPIQEHLRDKVEITRPFRKRKRYQNPDYYIRNNSVAVDEKEEETKAAEEQEKQEDTKDLSAAEKLKRKHDRAKTFGQVWGDIIAPESDLIQRYQLKTIEEKRSKVRTTSIHVTGVNNLSTEQVFQYFKQHPPESLEWVDDDSCNIVYETEKECSSCFLRFLSTTMPEYHRVSRKKINEKTEKPMEEKEESSKENWEKESVEEGELDDEAIQNSENCVKLGDDLIYISGKKEENLDDLKSKLTSIWRFGPVKIIDNQILLFKCRYAVEDDRKEQNSMAKSKYYRDHGNPYFGNMKGIISSSFKQRYLKSKTDSGFNVERASKKRPGLGDSSVFSRLGRKRDWDDAGPEEMSASDVKDLIRKTAHVPILESRIVERRISTSSSSGEEENKSRLDSEDEFMMTLKANKRMKLYSDDLIEKQKQKQKKSVTPKHAAVNPRLDIKHAPVLKVEMVNEYAEMNLQRIRAKERIGHKSQNDGLKVTPDGFIDTRDLFKEEIEEAKEEKESNSSSSSSSESEDESKDKKSRSKKKTENSKSVDTVRVTFTNDRTLNDDRTQEDKNKSLSADRSVSSKEGTAELNKTEIRPKIAAEVPNTKKDVPDVSGVSTAKPNRVKETPSAKPLELKNDSRLRRSRSPRDNREYRDANRRNRNEDPSRRPQRSPDRSAKPRAKVSERNEEKRRRSGSRGRKEVVSNEGAPRARDERSRNHEKPIAKSSREIGNRNNLASNTNKAKEVDAKESERLLVRKRRQEEIEKKRSKLTSKDRNDRKVKSISRTRRPQKKRRKSVSSSSSSSGSSSSSESSGSDSEGSSSSSDSSSSSESSSSSSSSSDSEN